MLRALAMAALLMPAIGAYAATDAEMEEAHAITAKYYIRYINDGAGYLDNWQPKSMDELQKKLTNATDKENFQKFKGVATPTDYASWDKAKLAAYWSDEFFRENGSSLNAKAAQNGLCKKQIKQTIEKMAVAAPAALQEAAMSEQAQAPAEQRELTPEEVAIADELAQVEGEIQEAHDLVNQEESAPAHQSGSVTWVYIVILAILVAVVIFLVVFASRTMKGHPKTGRREEEEIIEEDDEGPVALPAPEEEEITAKAVPIQARASVADDSRMREKYAENLAAKAEEIRNLNRQLADMETLAASLKEENRRLAEEVEWLRCRSAAHSERPAMPERPAARPSGGGTAKEIYLGRVNSKGIFVRADRHAVDGQSIYKLTTANGTTGSFTLVRNPLIEDQALDDPGKWLAGGCFAKDIFDTEGKQGITVENPGLAVFRDGAWRVERKVKIRYN